VGAGKRPEERAGESVSRKDAKIAKGNDVMSLSSWRSLRRSGKAGCLGDLGKLRLRFALRSAIYGIIGSKDGRWPVAIVVEVKGLASFTVWCREVGFFT